MVWLSSFPENERVGIQFRDFELFCRLLKNLDDFTVAVKYISEVGRPLSRKEFKRAAKVCLNGKELSSHLVDTVFILFGASEGKKNNIIALALRYYEEESLTHHSKLKYSLIHYRSR